MKGLTFTKLEEIINERGVKLYNIYDRTKEQESTEQRHLISSVENEILNVLSEYGYERREVRLTEYRGKLYLRSDYDEWYNGAPDGVEIVIRKKKDTNIPSYRGTYYKFDHIEIAKPIGREWSSFKEIEINTIDEYIENRRARLIHKNKVGADKVEQFKNKLSKANMDLKTFLDLMIEFKGLDYDKKGKYIEEETGDSSYRWKV